MTGRIDRGRDLQPLQVTCSSAECESGLHYFKPTPKMREMGEEGRCRYCG